MSLRRDWSILIIEGLLEALEDHEFQEAKHIMELLDYN